MTKSKRKSKALQLLDDCTLVLYEPAALKRKPCGMTKEEWDIYKCCFGSMLWGLLSALEGH